MSSDEEIVNDENEISENEQTNEILEIGEDLQDQEEQTEEVQRDETADGEENGESGEKKTVKVKRVIRNPRPTLNAETLKGYKGIAALENYFERVKFKGKGYEQQDLEVVMKTYEYWCHRLFPKFPFDTCIEKLETLGSKRAVQTHIKRIRFDLLLEDKPILDDSDEEPNVEGFVDIQSDEINQQQNQQFNQLISSSAPVITPVELTVEQLERIRLNKERAEKLKQERLRKIRDRAEETLQVSSQLPGTSGLGNNTNVMTSESAGKTQSDIFSQDNCTTTLTNSQNFVGEIKDLDNLFDHESNVKGKTNYMGANIMKKSSKSNKKTSPFNSDLDTRDDNKMKDNVQNNHVLSQENICLDIDQNSCDSDFAPQKTSKRSIINDSNDNSSIGEDGQNQKLLRSKHPQRLSSDDDSDHENHVKNNASHKSLPKSSILSDTDESDREEQGNQFPREINGTKNIREKLYHLDNSHNDQEMESSQLRLWDSNTGNELVKHSSDLDSLGQKADTMTILNSVKNNETDLVPGMKVAKKDQELNSVEPMEIIENKLEGVKG